MTFGKVGVLYGGVSAEREVSLKSGAMVLAALQRKGIDAHGFDTGTQALSTLGAQGYERVFIALHGRGGEDGTIQGVLELLGIPYTGSGVMASAIAIDKVYTKRIWQTHGLPTPKYVALDKAGATPERLRALPDELGLPFMAKAPNEGSTIGIVKIAAAADIQSAFDVASAYDDVVLFEQFIDGAELTCAVLEHEGRTVALPTIQIVAPGGNYDYFYKYVSNDTQYLCPAPLDAALEARIRELAVASFEALDCAGWARADFMLAKDGTPYLLEINTSPGMTDHSLVPMAARAAGMNYEDLVVAILSGASLKAGLTHKHVSNDARAPEA